MAIPDPRCVIYSLSSDGNNHRYVGYTQAGLRKRMDMHRFEARRGTERPPYSWIREVGLYDVVATVLERLPLDSSIEELGAAEVRWIARLRADGHHLLNRATGGPGVPGVKKTPEQRAAISERVKLQDISHLWTPEVQERRRLAAIGSKHKPHEFKDPETHAEAGKYSAHKRWHIARNIVNNDCTHCVL